MNTILIKENSRRIKRLRETNNEKIKEKVNTYYNYILNREIPNRNANIKITNKTFTILDIDEYELLLENNYSNDYLKQICKHYKQKLSGTKTQLVNRLYNYLKLTYNIIKIQKVWRGFLLRKYIHYHGPAFINRKLCVNDTDFYTLDKLDSIPYEQFFSFKDNENFIYGFDLLSIYNLLITKGSKLENPYNKKELDSNIINNVKQFIKFSRILKIPLEIEIKESEYNIDTNLNMRIVSLFQNMDSLGNYTDIRWFTELNNIKLIIFIKELNDIWVYRAQIDPIIKKEICPPYGDPFRHVNFSTLNNHFLINLQKISLGIIEKFVLSGINVDSRTLGTYYILSALTLVSNEAAIAMPWLYHSVAI